MRHGAWVYTHVAQAQKSLSTHSPWNKDCHLVVGGQVRISVNGVFSGKEVANGALAIVNWFDLRSVIVYIQTPHPIG